MTYSSEKEPVRLIPVKYQPISYADYLLWRQRFYQIYLKNKWIPWLERLPKIGYWLWCRKLEKEQKSQRLIKEIMES